MVGWFSEIAMTMPQIMPATTSSTSAWKLSDEAFISCPHFENAVRSLEKMTGAHRFCSKGAEDRGSNMVLSRLSRQCEEPTERTTSIEPLSPAVRDYFRAFDLTAIALMRDGGITAKRDPAGAATAW